MLYIPTTHPFYAKIQATQKRAKPMKKLPIGIQSLSNIREDNYIYIDKTKEALELIENSKYYFLSRPRRFGKSLFLDTLSSIFEGKQELFKGLYIYDKYDWSKSYPVIKIDFGNQKAETPEKLKSFILHRLKDVAKSYAIELEREEYYEAFKELITALKEKTNSQVVVLVDEYDKPILDNIENLPLAKEFREILKGFYTIIKGADEDLKFAFLTGVSKFAKTSIFSGLNNLKDISLDKRYSTICGYTQKDVEESFEEYLEDVDIEEVKRWYNGYSWLGISVYNPFDILLFLDSPDKEFRAYWFETGTPTFLIKLIEEKGYYLPNLESCIVGDSLVNSFEIEDIKIESILFQSGYLTIKNSQRTGAKTTYTLKIPNIEVQSSFAESLIPLLTKEDAQTRRQIVIYNALFTADLETFKTTIISLFASIPYNNYTKNKIENYEGYYASVIYAYLASLGIDMIAEDTTNKGRIDLTLKLQNFIYILEFKVDGEGKALKQIKDKNYADKYKNENKEIWLVGVEFDSVSRGVGAVEWERG